jgi:hypothetical protein
MRFLGKASPAVPLRMPGLLTVGPHDCPGMRGPDQRPGRKPSRFNCEGASPLMADHGVCAEVIPLCGIMTRPHSFDAGAVCADRTLAASPEERTSSAGDDQLAPIDMG